MLIVVMEVDCSKETVLCISVNIHYLKGSLTIDEKMKVLRIPRGIEVNVWGKPKDILESARRELQ